MEYIIGVDIGTSGTKAIAFSTQGAVLANYYVSYERLPGEAGIHELDPEALLEAVVTSIGEVVMQMGTTRHLLGISFSSFMHGLMALDKQGRPLTNIITWADLRSNGYAQTLLQSETGKQVYRNTGTPIHPMSPLCKLMWMKENDPRIFAAAHRFVSIKEYLFYRLFDRFIIDHSVASGTGLFDIMQHCWYAPSLQMAGITEQQLPEPVPTTYIMRGMKKEWAAKLKLDADVPFVVGGSDGCLANLGSHATKPGDLCVTIGTSGAVRMITNNPRYDEQQRVFNYILTEKEYVCGGPTNNGLNILKWYAAGFLQRPIREVADIDWFVREAAKAPQGAGGLVFLPYLHGERAPVWDAHARGVFLGLHSGHTQSHIMRAIIEGINYSLYQIASCVEASVGTASHIYGSGGFIHSRLWLQWMANLFGKSITVSSTADASATGAAVLGLSALGKMETEQSGHNFVRTTETFLPQQASHAHYMKAYTVYASLYNKLKIDFRQLSDLAM